MKNIHLRIKNLVGEVWKNNDKYEENYKLIINLLNNELENDPDDIVALTNLGAACCDTGKYKEAKEYLKKAITLKSQDKNTYFNLGIALMNTEAQDKAKKYFKKSSGLKRNELTYEAYIDFHGY